MNISNWPQLSQPQNTRCQSISTMGDFSLPKAGRKVEVENRENDLVSVIDGSRAPDRTSQYLSILIMWELSVSCRNNQAGLIYHIDTPCVDTMMGDTDPALSPTQTSEQSSICQIRAE